VFDEELFARVRGKLRAAPLIECADYWAARRGARPMPRRADIDLADLTAHAPRLILAEVWRAPLRFHLALVGGELETKLGRKITGEVLTEDSPMFYRPYAKCAENVRAVREFLSFNFAESEAPATFERLLLPLSDDGETVDSILGEAVYTNLTTDPNNLA
jgi:hypothetical protein